MEESNMSEFNLREFFADLGSLVGEARNGDGAATAEKLSVLERRFIGMTDEIERLRAYKERLDGLERLGAASQGTMLRKDLGGWSVVDGMRQLLAYRRTAAEALDAARGK